MPDPLTLHARGSSLRDADGHVALVASDRGTATDDEALARRLVACWRACEGRSTEALERVAGVEANPKPGAIA